MRHREATVYLPDFGSGSLEPQIETAIVSHADGCSACRDWLATHRLLAVELGRPRDGGLPHPGSDLLALCVVRPEEIHELDREGLRAHLRSCPDCRGDLELMRSAVKTARPKGDGEAYPQASALPMIRGLSRRSLRAAAAIFTVLLGGGLLAGLGLYVQRLIPPETALHEEASDATRPPALPQPVEELSGRDLDGTQTIGSEQALLVSKLTVRSRADVTIRGGEVVAFGDGFRVDAGARMRVESRPSAKEDSRSAEGGQGPDRSMN